MADRQAQHAYPGMCYQSCSNTYLDGQVALIISVEWTDYVLVCVYIGPCEERVRALG